MKRKVKRFITILLTTIMMSSVMLVARPITAYAKEIHTYAGFEFEVKNAREATITGYSGEPQERLVIPQDVITENEEGYVVTGIGEGAFANYPGSPRDVEIPDVITSIHDTAFAGMYSVTYINNLSEVEIPASCFIEKDSGDIFVNVIDSNTKIGYKDFLGKGDYNRAYVTSIAFRNVPIPPAKKILQYGETFDLNVKLLPSYINQEVTWSSSNPENVAVSEDGVVTGYYGEATITATSKGKDSSGKQMTASCIISVTGGTTDDGFNYLFANSNVMIKGYYGVKSGRLVIPSKINGRQVVEIRNDAFINCINFTGDLDIPSGVEGVGDGAFYGCSGFDGCLTIPDSVTYIYTSFPAAFSGLFKISEIKNNCNVEMPARWFIENGSSDYFVNVDNPSEVVRSDGNIGTGHYKRGTGTPPQSIASATVSGISNKTYTGNAITQSPTVTLDGKALNSGTDYTISYANNVSVGTATITITGKDSYFGSITKTFTIAKADQTITASDITKTTEDAAFSISAKTNGDSQLSYSSANTAVLTVDNTGNATIKGAGKTTITVTASATGNYNQASKTINVTVTAPEKITKEEQAITENSTAKKSIAKASVTGLKSKTYTGKALTQNLKVKLGNNNLKVGTDYTVSYKNNKNVGTATITITGKGNFTGKKTVKFKIKKAANSLNVKAKKNTFNITYSKLAKKDQGIKQTQIYTLSKKGQGKLSYKLSSVKNGKKKVKAGFTVDKKNGKLTLKKGLQKGTYNVEVLITAAGDKNHNKTSNKIKISVKVK